MVNTIQSADRISSLLVELLYRRTTLLSTVARQSFSDFTGGGGDTVTVRVREKVATRRRATANQGDAIVRDNVVEVAVPVVLAELYSAVPVTNAEWELELENFGAQILGPQAAGMVEGVEDELIVAMNALAADASFDLAASAADTEAKLIAASEALDNLDVPMDGRYLAISPAIKSRMLAVPNFVRTDGIGNGTAIERATFGSILGFTVVVNNALTTGTAVAYHRSGFAAAMGARSAPAAAGVTGSSQSLDGIAMLWLRQWNDDTVAEESVVQTFAGASAVDAGNRVYVLDTSAT